ncbi:hypothetical protein HDV05_003403 [Chytridiales sp. JEL 0842]|nr:hypothetical protein HDV05_003403 [Chytridiales sp. JEL 0842]
MATLHHPPGNTACTRSHPAASTPPSTDSMLFGSYIDFPDDDDDHDLINATPIQQEQLHQDTAALNSSKRSLPSLSLDSTHPIDHHSSSNHTPSTLPATDLSHFPISPPHSFHSPSHSASTHSESSLSPPPPLNSLSPGLLSTPSEGLDDALLNNGSSLFDLGFVDGFLSHTGYVGHNLDLDLDTASSSSSSSSSSLGWPGLLPLGFEGADPSSTSSTVSTSALNGGGGNGTALPLFPPLTQTTDGFQLPPAAPLPPPPSKEIQEILNTDSWSICQNLLAEPVKRKPGRKKKNAVPNDEPSQAAALSSQHQPQSTTSFNNDPLRPLVPTTTTSTASSPPPLIKTESDSDTPLPALPNNVQQQQQQQQPQPQTSAIDKRHERLLKNREAADQSRRRKKEHLHTLESLAERLMKENELLKGRLKELEGYVGMLRGENEGLRARMVSGTHLGMKRKDSVVDFEEMAGSNGNNNGAKRVKPATLAKTVLMAFFFSFAVVWFPQSPSSSSGNSKSLLWMHRTPKDVSTYSHSSGRVLSPFPTLDDPTSTSPPKSPPLTHRNTLDASPQVPLLASPTSSESPQKRTLVYALEGQSECGPWTPSMGLDNLPPHTLLLVSAEGVVGAWCQPPSSSSTEVLVKDAARLIESGERRVSTGRTDLIEANGQVGEVGVWRRYKNLVFGGNDVPAAAPVTSESGSLKKRHFSIYTQQPSQQEHEREVVNGTEKRKKAGEFLEIDVEVVGARIVRFGNESAVKG